MEYPICHACRSRVRLSGGLWRCWDGCGQQYEEILSPLTLALRLAAEVAEASDRRLTAAGVAAQLRPEPEPSGPVIVAQRWFVDRSDLRLRII